MAGPSMGMGHHMHDASGTHDRVSFACSVNRCSRTLLPVDELPSPTLAGGWFCDDE
jgi:hypothetical protein